MYKSLEEICEMTTKEGKPFWKIVQEDDCREQGISEEKPLSRCGACIRQCVRQMTIMMES